MSNDRRLPAHGLGRDDLTYQAADPGVSLDPGLEEATPGSEQRSTAQRDAGPAQYRDGYSMMAPNVTKRSQIQQMANKELEELRQWKEAHKPGPISMTPTQLGGHASMHEVRRQQQINLLGSKLRQRVKKEEQDQKRREEQELRYQKMKEIQREKANKLVEKRRQEDQQSKAQHQAQHYQSNQQFLDRMDASRCNSQSHLRPSFADSTRTWAKSHTYQELLKKVEDWKLQEMKDEQRRKSEYLTEKESQLEAEQQKRLQEDHRRKNNAFLDELERRQSGGNTQHLSPSLSDENPLGEEIRECISSTSDGEVQEDSRDALTICETGGGSPEGIEQDWDLMKLSASFPGYHPTILKEFLEQCQGDYARVVQLLQ